MTSVNEESDEDVPYWNIAVPPFPFGSIVAFIVAVFVSTSEAAFVIASTAEVTLDVSDVTVVDPDVDVTVTCGIVLAVAPIFRSPTNAYA